MPAQTSFERTFIVGFDYGTHSTKVVLRQRDEVGGRVVKCDDEADGYSEMVAPSLVRVCDGRLYFGALAGKIDGGQLFSSLKVRLIGANSRPGERDEEAEFLIAAYMTWAFQQLRKAVPDLDNSRVLLNISAPTTDVGEKRLIERYLRVCHAAWRLTFTDSYQAFPQGISSAEARNAILPIFEQQIPKKEERNFYVLPETIAPIVSLQQHPYMEPGMYMVIDTGASTTEVSVFHVGENESEDQVLCYFDETQMLGGNELVAIYQLPVGESEIRLEALLCALRKMATKVWYTGFRKDSAIRVAKQRWKGLKIVLSGGGTLDRHVQKFLDTLNPIAEAGSPRQETTVVTERHVPGQLEPNAEIDDQTASLFAVANGLSIERRKWPKVYHEHDIETLVDEQLMPVPTILSYLEME